MNKYELIYIIDPAVEDEARKALADRFNGLVETLGGKVNKVEDWGKRHLAYAINFKTEGYYLLVEFEADASVPKEMERNLQISDSVIRYQIVKVENKRSNVKPRAARPAAPAAEEPAAPAAEEAAPEAEKAE